MSRALSESWSAHLHETLGDFRFRKAFPRRGGAYTDVPLRRIPPWSPQPPCTLADRVWKLQGDTSGVEHWSFQSGQKILGSGFARKLATWASDEKDPFVAALDSHWRTDILYIPPRTVVKEPLQLRAILNEHDWECHRLIVLMGAHSRATLCWSHEGPPAQASLLSVSLDEGAQLECFEIEEPCTRGWDLRYLRADLKSHARFHWHGASRGGECVRWDHRAQLHGEQADATFAGLFQLKDSSQGHILIDVEHRAPHTRSRQEVRSLVGEASMASFEGRIFVAREAQQTDAYQLNNNLLLHETARAHSRPTLDIIADDVKASHGSTTGFLEREPLFYLQSRGIAYAEAVDLMTQGFMDQILKKFPEALRDVWRGCG